MILDDEKCLCNQELSLFTVPLLASRTSASAPLLISAPNDKIPPERGEEQHNDDGAQMKKREREALPTGEIFPLRLRLAPTSPSRPSALMRTSIRLFASDCHDARPSVRPSVRPNGNCTARWRA